MADIPSVGCVFKVIILDNLILSKKRRVSAPDMGFETESDALPTELTWLTCLGW